MAPEQRVGARTTPAGDQYSFCVSLWEALAGARPGVASQPRPIRRAIRRVLERGLAADPDERWPSMAALLDELEPAARLPRIAIAASVIAVASVGVAIAIALREPERPSCAPAQDRLAGVWDADRKATMHSAFLASRLPYAEHTWQLVEQTLDGYAAGWAKRSDDTCHATEHAELPRAVADARRQCLDHRLDRLRLWVDLFSERDPRLVRDGTRAAGGLEDLADCDDPEAVSDMQPTNPILAAEVTALRERVNAAALSTTYRDYGKGVAQLRELAVAVKALDYQPLVVETLIQIGHAEYVGTEYKASLATFAAVRDLVETTHQDLQRARAWSGMSYVYGMLQQYDAAHDAARVARAILRPLSSSAARQARIGVDQSEAVAYWGEGKRDDALELLRKVDRELRAINGDRFQLAGNEVTLGGLLGEIGRYDDGNAYLDRALHRYIELQGDSHPAIASIINNQGGNYFFQGDYVHAAERYREAIAARDRAGIPADNIGRAYNWLNLGEALVHLGRADDALDAIAKARPIVASKLGEATTVFAELLTYTALAELARAKPDAALPSAERAVAIYRSVKPDPDDLAEAELAFARAVWPTDRVRARELAAAARDHFTKAPRKQEVEQWLASHR
jgi:tetratricopeptide (TPR) repeat protein